ncbi:MAG: ABC transporter permease [Clostridiales bacterium]|jgi:ABC-2 type transport system permease protein|nr:ABC transporter permease [Clostridiales bacterium]
MSAIFKKEIKSYFYSPMAYILIGIFTVLTSIFFYPYLAYYKLGDFSVMLDTISFFLIFIIPVFTMRLLTEDRKNGAEALLLTSPTSLPSVVLGKYLAALFVFFVMVAVSWVYPVIQVAFGGRISAQLVGGYLGYFLLGASFIAFGLFASSLTENQIIAAVISVAGLLVIQIAESLSSMLGGIPGQVLEWLSLLSRYRDFSSGIFGIAPIVYFLSFIALFLFLTVRVIDKRRWSQG